MKIPERFNNIAHQVLQLLAFDLSDKGFSDLYILTKAIVVDVDQLSFSPNKRLLGPDFLFKIYTCLIRYISKEKVKLAHYLVKEYLDSNQIQCGPAVSFQISEIRFGTLATKISFIYLLDITSEGS